MKLLTKLKMALDPRNVRGDTIVEVLVSVAILSIVLGTAYITSSRSLQTGTNAGNRNQALGYAQQQLEKLKAIAQTTPSTVPTAERFCFDPAVTGSPVRTLGPTETCTIPETGYSVAVTYNPPTCSCPNPNVYIVAVNWESADGREEDESLIIHYRLSA